ncbi:MAG: M14 family metallopeptidase [Chitinophagaceae bacterium]
MHKIKLLAVVLSFTSYLFAQQNSLQTKDFFGYTIGTKFTRHHQIVDYFKSVAAANSQVMQLQQYGTTNEGRPLYLAFISSKENLENLETIKSNNLTYAGLNKAIRKAPLLPNKTAIVWLSYNVHGNEPASSEAALLTLEALVVKPNEAVKEWLKNVVVIIDPCLNPDGRDRYVNWYNNAVGKNLNADPQAREHQEPWPQGRTNHYNFDLNRDWAWQTQAETKARMVYYKEWMPHVHVDFHEQGFNEPYYFAPAAEPVHEVVTKWQRDFQHLVGKNHAKYFDDKGWLYFTKERFDIFYPSYGDSYPMYNGSIGMTYEQGGIRAGLGIKTNEGDTLTLVDRAQHHFVTSLSTIEMASKNATQLVDEFIKFCGDAKEAKNFTFKTYLLTTNNLNKLLAVKQLLDNCGIEYGKLKPMATTNTKQIGFNYFDNKDEVVEQQEFSLAISAAQPRGALVNVLFEPKSKLSDSATYDITAWSLPYVFGVDGYAFKDKREIIEADNLQKENEFTSSSYGYAIEYNSINSAKLLAYLHLKQVKVRVANKAFEVGKSKFAAGSLLVLKNLNAGVSFGEIVAKASKEFNVIVKPLSTGFVDKGPDFGSPEVQLLKAPKVAMLTGEQVGATDAGEVWHYFEHELQYPISQLLTENLGRINLKNYDVIVIPDGYYRSLNDKSTVEKLKDFVKSGGKIVAIGGAVNILAEGDWGIKNKVDKEDEKEKIKDEYAALKKYNNRDREYLHENIPGAIYKVELDNSHPLAYGYENVYFTLKQDANIYEFLKDGWNVGVLKKDNYVAGFTGFKVKNKLKDGTLFGVSEMGNGAVIYLADNPIFRQFWHNGKLILANAVFMVQ